MTRFFNGLLTAGPLRHLNNVAAAVTQGARQQKETAGLIGVAPEPAGRSESTRIAVRRPTRIASRTRRRRSIG